MGKKSLVAALAFLMLGHSAAKAADTDSGNVWLERCQSSEPANKFACVAFVSGFTNGITAQAMGSQAPKIYCQPDGVTYGQSADIWVRYMRENPSQRHYLGGVLLMLSHMQAFPCPKGKK